MPKKIYFSTTEIIPFANTSSLAAFSTAVPTILQELEHDIRTILPKYGFVSERKYILREVIRLREIPFEFCGEEVIASAKSGFIPKTRVQVYFLEDEYWFKPLTNLLYKSKNGRLLTDNAKRYAYFSRAVISTLPHLFWVPDIFVCNGWQSALIPNIYKDHYEGINEFYKNIKTVLIIHDLDEYSAVSKTELLDMGISIHPNIKGNKLNIYDVASYSADAILIIDRPGNKISTKLLNKSSFKDNKKKVTVFEQKEIENINYSTVTKSLDQIISDLT
ncbi:MAG: hypothetical protein CBD44_01850 [Flavobacteriaceae bacterium TMED184]|nr:MAG: hypothetical protein CBD44_01850 [Flavobacteriaceae bacterium TMED184]|tara:strand:+ start:2796 stop:3623 length:828 start_codon:yes stop_codon:yes gene_type:complete